MVGENVQYDVVIATRNRPESLVRCLECFEAQTELPTQVIIVDASDDPDFVKETALASRRTDVTWHWVNSPVRSTAAQRNVGLDLVTSDVAFLPDDDSLFFPNAAAEIMAAYRRDADGRVAGVSARGADHSPRVDGQTQISRSARYRARLLPFRNRVERALIPRPFETYPHLLWSERTFPYWVDGENYVPVETIGGYLLTLRTDYARRARFDEVLGYAAGYALHEDMEMSLRLQNEGYVLVAAHRASVFHDVHPAKRAGGFVYGFCWIANYVYSCARNIPRHTRPWRQMHRFLRYKILLYGIRALVSTGTHNRDIFRGARAAWRHRDELIKVEAAELAEAYRRLCDHALP